MLYIIATPIGHLEDLSPRAISTLKDSDFVLCEDTRHSGKMLCHFGIQKKLIAYHKFNEQKILDQVIDLLQQGKQIALISDAGTPTVNDPGLIIVQACIQRNLPITTIPGPCSLIAALVLSGIDSSCFQYIGFLPKKGRARLQQALCYPGTTIALESPQRLISTLEEIRRIDPKRHIAVAREITKLHEECIRGDVTSVLMQCKEKPLKGEIVLVISEGFALDGDEPVEELIKLLQDLHGLSLKQAIKVAAKLTKTPKRDLYKTAIAFKK